MSRNSIENLNQIQDNQIEDSPSPMLWVSNYQHIEDMGGILYCIESCNVRIPLWYLLDMDPTRKVWFDDDLGSIEAPF